MGTKQHKVGEFERSRRVNTAGSEKKAAGAGINVPRGHQFHHDGFAGVEHDPGVGIAVLLLLQNVRGMR